MTSNLKKLSLATLMASALLIPALGHAADDKTDSDRSHPTAFVKDSAITTKVKAKLAAKHLRSMAQIHVDTDANGVVWLTGTARSQDEIDQAVMIARDTERVKSVKNQLTVKADN